MANLWRRFPAHGSSSTPRLAWFIKLEQSHAAPAVADDFFDAVVAASGVLPPRRMLLLGAGN